MRGRTMSKRHLLLATGVVGALLVSSVAVASSAVKIDREVTKTIAIFKEDVNGSDVFLSQAAGYLVFPKVYKAGFVDGADTGEVSLIVAGKTVDYYRTSAGSFGFQAGAQAKSIVIRTFLLTLPYDRRSVQRRCAR